MNNENSAQPVYDDEINLMDYIKVIIKRKKIILGIFIVCVAAAVVISLLKPKVYQSAASIMIIDQEPKDSLSTQKVLLKSNAVLERVVNRLNLTDSSGSRLSPNDISGKLDVKEVKKTNVLRLEAKDLNPEAAKELANAWADEYIKYSQKLISGEVKSSGDFIASQFEIAKKNLSQAEGKVRDFKDKHRIDLMQAELEIKKGGLNSRKKELMALVFSLKTKKDSLKELQKEIATQDKFIIVSKAITDDALWQKEGGENNLGDFNKKKLRSEEINPIYQNLETRIVNTNIELNTLEPKVEYLKKSIALLEKEINELEKTISQNQFELTWLNRQADIYKKTYDNLSAKIESARITRVMVLGNVKDVSPAVKPKFPVEPKKRQMAAISAVLGLMLGIFIAFFVEFWEKNK